MSIRHVLRPVVAIAGLLLACAHPARATEPTIPASVSGALEWRQLGPFRGGWATMAAGVPTQPDTFYIGTAGGGVWKTIDAGRTWQSLFDRQPASAVGALAVAPSDPEVIYVGTGQVAARYDVGAGNGVYRSADGGKTWQHAGLADSRHIGAILVDPQHPDTVLVGALGDVGWAERSDRRSSLLAEGERADRSLARLRAGTRARPRLADLAPELRVEARHERRGSD